MRFEALAALAGRAVTDTEARAAVMVEIEAGARYAADLPSTHTNLAVLRWSNGDSAGARAALETALKLDPSFAPAVENLRLLDVLEAR